MTKPFPQFPLVCGFFLRTVRSDVVRTADHTNAPQIKAYFRLFAVHLHIVPSPQKKLFTDRHTIVAVLGGCPPEAKIMRDLREDKVVTLGGLL